MLYLGTSRTVAVINVETRLGRAGGGIQGSSFLVAIKRRTFNGSLRILNRRVEKTKLLALQIG